MANCLQEPTLEDESDVPSQQCTLFRWCPLGGSDGYAGVPAALEEAGGVPHALEGF